MSITLIGLGIKAGDLTRSAERALEAAEKIFARTSQTDSFKGLEGYAVETLDSVFAASRNFDTLNKNLANTVLQAGKTANVDRKSTRLLLCGRSCQRGRGVQNNIEER